MDLPLRVKANRQSARTSFLYISYIGGHQKVRPRFKIGSSHLKRSRFRIGLITSNDSVEKNP